MTPELKTQLVNAIKCTCLIRKTYFKLLIKLCSVKCGDLPLLINFKMRTHQGDLKLFFLFEEIALISRRHLLYFSATLATSLLIGPKCCNCTACARSKWSSLWGSLLLSREAITRLRFTKAWKVAPGHEFYVKLDYFLFRKYDEIWLTRSAGTFTESSPMSILPTLIWC